MSSTVSHTVTPLHTSQLQIEGGIMQLFICALLLVSGFQAALSANADLCFLIDDSGSIPDHETANIKLFMSNFVLQLDLDETRVGVVKFAWAASLEIDIATHTSNADQADLIDEIDNLPLNTFGGTDTTEGIETVMSQCFPSNDRVDSPNVIILLTDGVSNDHAAAVAASQVAQDADVTVIVIGIGSLSQTKLEDLASEDDMMIPIVFKFTDFNELVNQTKTVFDKFCEVIIPRVGCTAEFNDEDLWDFAGYAVPGLGAETYNLIEWEPSGSNCKFSLVWNRELDPWNTTWFSIHTGVHPSKPHKKLRNIDFDRKPLVGKAPGQRGWHCKDSDASACPGGPHYVTPLPYTVNSQEPNAVNVATVSDISTAAFPYKFSVELHQDAIDADCSGEDESPDYRLEFEYDHDQSVSPRMRLTVDQAWYEAHKSELTGICVPAEA